MCLFLHPLIRVPVFDKYVFVVENIDAGPRSLLRIFRNLLQS